MKTTLLSFICFVTFFLNGMLFAQTASYKIIVNSNNPISSISAEDISDLFLKKVIEWDNGITVVPVDKEENSPERISFSNDILKRSVTAVTAYWYQKLFTGRDEPPRIEQFDEDILKFVHANTGAIAYVAKTISLNNFNVKVIEVIDRF